eukprot:1139367-Pelagomonas_calceolata.AAC.1
MDTGGVGNDLLRITIPNNQTQVNREDSYSLSQVPSQHVFGSLGARACPKSVLPLPMCLYGRAHHVCSFLPTHTTHRHSRPCSFLAPCSYDPMQYKAAKCFSGFFPDQASSLAGYVRSLMNVQSGQTWQAYSFLSFHVQKSHSGSLLRFVCGGPGLHGIGKLGAL